MLILKQGDWVIDNWYGQPVLVVAISKDGKKVWLARKGATSDEGIYYYTDVLNMLLSMKGGGP